MAFEKIKTHPDVNEIIKRLTRGEGVRAVAKVLAERYPNDKKLQVTSKTLQDFRTRHLKMNSAKIQKAKQKVKEKIVEKTKKEKENWVSKNSAFKDAVKEAANLEISIEQELKELHLLIKTRTADLFDKAERGEITVNEEKNLQAYFSTWIANIEKWAKFVEKIADKTVETNVNITVIEDQMAVIREAIKETFQEVSPELLPKFLEKLSANMNVLNYRQRPKETLTQMKNDTHLLGATIAVMDAEEDEYGVV